MNSAGKLPFYVKASIFLVGLYVLITMLSKVQDIVLPIIYSGILSILISPVINYLVKKNINRALAISVVLGLAFILFTVLILMLSSQASLLVEAWPVLSAKFQVLLKQSVSWASGYFNISVRKINLWINDTQSDLFNNSGAVIGMTLTTLGGVLGTLFLTPVYIFMLLYYQPHLIQFIHKLFGTSEKVGSILTETRKIVQNYLLGLLAEFGIVAGLNSIGLLMLGIDYAILLGIFGAILNIIPYLGGVIAIFLFMIIALVTKPPIYILYVFILYLIIQFIDNNFIVPKIIGSKVKLNAFFSLLAVILGAALWGIPGMFLSIPITAILKLIFDHSGDLKPWGFLLGDTTAPVISFKSKRLK
ncbi:MAG: AI-2E family transporter [Saprospiraceae bacterium]